MGQIEAGKEACKRSASLARALGQVETHARAALAWGSPHAFGRADAWLAEQLYSALQLGLGDDGLRVRVMAHLAGAIDAGSEREKAQTLARTAVGAARDSGDRRLLADVLSAARDAFNVHDALEARTAIDRELALLAATLGDKLLELLAHRRLMLDAIERGDAASVEIELRIQRRLVEETRVPQHRLGVACMHLTWMSLVGNPEAIAAAEHEVRELSEGDGGISGRAAIATHRYLRALVSGDIHEQLSAAVEAEAVLTQPSASAPMLPLWRAAALPTIQHEAIRAQLSELCPRGLHEGLSPATIACVASTCIRIGERSWMQQAYDLLRPLAPHNTILLTPDSFALGPVNFFLGRLAAALGDPEKATYHFRAMLEVSQRAGFRYCESHAQRELGMLDRRTPAPSRKHHSDPPPHLEREGELWLLRHDRREVRLKDTKGVWYLATLLREPGREFHVHDLVTLSSGIEPVDVAALRDSDLHVGRLGDAGEWLDSRAREAYRRRLTTLTDALDGAGARGDHEAISRLLHEREMLAGELVRATGLAGSARRAGSLSERARVNVQRRIRDVVVRVSELDIAMGRHLEHHVKTGTLCSWTP